MVHLGRYYENWTPCTMKGYETILTNDPKHCYLICFLDKEFLYCYTEAKIPFQKHVCTSKYDAKYLSLKFLQTYFPIG